MTRLADIKKKWLNDPEVKVAFEAHDVEFAIARMLISARLKQNLTQKQVAERMHTSQSVVARLETGAQRPTISTIDRYAKAIGMRVELSLHQR